MKKQNSFRVTKRRWLLFLVVVSLTGCQVKQETPPPPPSPAPSPIQKPEVTETPNDTSDGQATATTKIYDKSPERTQNIILAIHAIDKTQLQPGEEFSFNQTVGDRTPEKGYQKAIGFDENGEKKPTFGGGICQVASTLYMAAKNGGFTITERHSHSHKVPYADSDNDATVSYGGYDFKFKNNRDKPIIISVFLDENTVTVQITPS